MSNGKRLSIILPVYNVEVYLERCVKSLLEQDIPQHEYEIIIVNDGSPDNSREVVLRLMKKFSNIVFIEQENKGVSIARNVGIDRARGKYLLFVDPDDFILRDSLARILTAADQHQAQIAFLGYRFLNVDGSTRAEILNGNVKDRLFCGVAAYHLSRGDGKLDPDRSWAILYESKYINHYNLRYLPNVPYLEDGEFLARVLCLADRCLFEGNPFYIRTTRQGSATNSKLFFSDRAIGGFILAAINLTRFRSGHALAAKQKEFLNQPICKFVLLSLTSFRSIKKFQEVVKELKTSGLENCALIGCNRYYRIEGWLYNISPYLYVLHRLLRTPLFKMVRS